MVAARGRVVAVKAEAVRDTVEEATAQEILERATNAETWVGVWADDSEQSSKRAERRKSSRWTRRRRA